MQGGMTANAVLKQPEVNEEMAFLDSATDALMGTVNRLVDRLCRVTSAKGPENTKAEQTAMRGVTAPIAQDIRQQRFRVDQARDILEDNLSRLEV